VSRPTHRPAPAGARVAVRDGSGAPPVAGEPAALETQRAETPAGPAFARGLWRIAAADVSSGNRVELLHDGPRTYEVMLAEIAAARETVVLESYILRSDETGQRFAAALGDAVTRGVAVRLLTDWIGMRGIRSAFVTALRRAGIDVRVFNTPGFRPWLGLVPRDHRKLLVADARVGITGGVGIGDEWMGKTSRHRAHWRDTAVRIEGPAARDMQTAFDTMWERAKLRERRGSHRITRRIARGAHLDPSTAEPALVGIVEGEPLRLRNARARPVQEICTEGSMGNE
jgi:cardiolipin synthase